MMSVDPLRRSALVRRARSAEPESRDDTHEAEFSNLPVVVTPARTIPPGPTRFGGQAAIHAQVIGERRGLRAGPSVHDQARSSYVRTEWSGDWDRRAPKGRIAKTAI